MNVKRLLVLTLLALFSHGVCVHSVLATEAKSHETSSTTSTGVEVLFETTLGAFTLELYPEKAPKTVENFLKYVDDDFYIGTLFHRIIPGFVAQGGGFGRGMVKPRTRSPVENESHNGLKNLRGTVSMARTNDPHSATSQFFINVGTNPGLDFRKNKPGYTVFGNVTKGMDVIDAMAAVPTTASRPYRDLPSEDIVILSAKQRDVQGGEGRGNSAVALETMPQAFHLGTHYTLLDPPVPTRDARKIEVMEAFSYSCPQCYKIDPLVDFWINQQADDVDFFRFHAVWSDPMKLYAQAFYTAKVLGVTDTLHDPLFTAILVKQRNLGNEREVGAFFEEYGVDTKAFSEAFHSTAVARHVRQSEERTRNYNLASVPEIVVNGRYRVDPMRAGTWLQMFAVVDFLVDKERSALKNTDD